VIGKGTVLPCSGLISWALNSSVIRHVPGVQLEAEFGHDTNNSGVRNDNSKVRLILGIMMIRPPRPAEADSWW
jgi:hypothetical protein